MEMKMEINNSCLVLPLPIKIVAEIFSRLPVHSVLQCKLVCKTWRDLMADHHHNNNSIVEMGGFLLWIPFGEPPGFHYGEYDDKKVPCFNLTKKTIFNHQYHPFENSRNWCIIGSCNGLICLRQKWLSIYRNCEPGTHLDDMYVCNPYTGEYAKLPNPSYPRLDHTHSVVYGFGYHPITKEYKVIRIYYLRIYNTFVPTTSVYVEVYTLGSASAAWRSTSTATAWRSIGKIKNKVYRSTAWGNESDNNSWGILLNGVLYWLTETTNLTIISFDLADEEFREIPTTLPEFSGPSVLGVLNGCLCFSTGRLGWGRYDSTRIWVMNNNDYSWIEKFSISWNYQLGFSKYYPLAHLESGKVLLHCNFEIFVSYDPETEHIVELKKMDNSFAIIPYMKSSVSLKALGEKEAIHVHESTGRN